MQNIHVKRFDHPDSTGYAAAIEPQDGSWVLFVPTDGSMPQLFMEVEVTADPEDDNPEAFAKAEAEGTTIATMKAYTPAIYLDDRVTVKPEIEPPCPAPEGTSGT